MTPHIACTLSLTAVEWKEVEDRVPLARMNQFKFLFLLTAISMFNGSFECMQDDQNMHMCVCVHVRTHMCAIQFMQRDILYMHVCHFCPRLQKERQVFSLCSFSVKSMCH